LRTLGIIGLQVEDPEVLLDLSLNEVIVLEDQLAPDLFDKLRAQKVYISTN